MTLTILDLDRERHHLLCCPSCSNRSESHSLLINVSQCITLLSACTEWWRRVSIRTESKYEQWHVEDHHCVYETYKDLFSQKICCQRRFFSALICANLFLLHPRACHLETVSTISEINNSYKSSLFVLETGVGQEEWNIITAVKPSLLNVHFYHIYSSAIKGRW